jgi:hypothetical protein
LRELPLHLICNQARNIYIYQRTMIHSRTVLSNLAAFAGLVEQFWPVGECAALQWLHRMYGTTVREQKCTLFMPRLPEAQQGRGSAEVTPLEFGAGDFEVPGEARDIFAGEVDKPLLLATAYASGLALKAHGRVYREFHNSRWLKAGARRVESFRLESK